MLELAWQLGNVSQACRVPELVQARFILPNLAMVLINLESPVVSLVLWGVRAVREPARRVP
ncbi:hypothetical protein SAMN05445850_8309 [Paraburkholderia tuberum]|uniref:Uncharacterized protein n=1 Tax=Paraburkholderia tuberum TaxID=157910 RepID=A0A1H1KKJ9_9BURK|nr:hypothetical protein SAMN05445850_8309 [Paraburkholderia tuberum]